MSLAFAEVSRVVAHSTSKVEPTALKYSKLCPILGDSIFSTVMVWLTFPAWP
jgi:hypothetical protein